MTKMLFNMLSGCLIPNILHRLPRSMKPSFALVQDDQIDCDDHPISGANIHLMVLIDVALINCVITYLIQNS